MSAEHEVAAIDPQNTPEKRFKRFSVSGVLRIGSAVVQAWGGTAGAEDALIVEAAEEFTDGVAFAGLAIESKTQRHGMVHRIRKYTVLAAAVAAGVATYGTTNEIMQEIGLWNTPIEGLDLTNPKNQAALAALALNAAVLFINRHGIKSEKPSDQFAFRDSIRDFILPGAVVGLSAAQAPHLGEFALEGGSAIYAWYNVAQLARGWFSRNR